MRIQKRLIGLLLVLAIALGLVGMTAASAEAFAGEIKDGILVKYTGDKYALTADDFPESVTVIGSSAFKGLPMTSVVLPNRVTSIGASAFEDCAQLTAITLPNQLKTIQEKTFNNCVELLNIVIPDTVTSIEAKAFSNCVKLQTVKGPAKKVDSINHPVNPTDNNYEAVTGYLTNVGTDAFYNCSRVHIWCVKGGALETYCTTNNINHTSLAPIVDVITVAKAQYTMVNGGEKTISVTIKPEVSAKEALAWTSTSELIMAVSQEGVIKGVAPGVVTITVRGDAYIVGKAGAMDATVGVVLDPTKSWQSWNGRWYYCNGTGVDSFAVGWNQISGVWYYFDEFGRMASGWQLIDKKWYYFNAQGIMQTSWQKIDGNWYYFGTDGAMRVDWQKISKKWYYFGTNGVMQTGWVMPVGDTHWYYLNEPEGYMMTNWQLIGGVWYYFNPKTGAMATGFTTIGKETYFMNALGIYQLGWQYLQNSWYFFGPDGVMRTGWQQIGGVWYYFNADGRMIAADWLKYGNNWYYFDGNGAMVTGTRVILGVTYTFDANGVWIK